MFWKKKPVPPPETIEERRIRVGHERIRSQLKKLEGLDLALFNEYREKLPEEITPPKWNWRDIFRNWTGPL